jgi:hypothetical protein
MVATIGRLGDRLLQAVAPKATAAAATRYWTNVTCKCTSSGAYYEWCCEVNGPCHCLHHGNGC